jgi:hypothetical protein
MKMGKGLTIKRLTNNRFQVFDGLTQQTTLYNIDNFGIILCESGKDRSSYRYPIAEMVHPRTDGSVSTFEIYRRAGVRQ